MKKIKFQERPDFWIPFLLYAGLLLFKLVFIIDNRGMYGLPEAFWRREAITAPSIPWRIPWP